MKNPTVLLLFSVILAMAAAASNQFASELFGLLAGETTDKNLILSPVSIESCLGLVYLGAEGATAEELAKGLKLDSNNKTEVAQKYEKLFAKEVDKEAAVQLKIGNRVYVDHKYKIATKFNALAERYFGAPAETLDFAQSHESAEKINAWVEEQTDNKIHNLIAADSLDASTASVLVNGIYFKATWWNEFDGISTKKKPFSVGGQRKSEVDMMYQKDRFLYGDFVELNAKAVEMKYRGTDITMLIVLPNEIDGLAGLEEKLKAVDLRRLSEKMSTQKVKLSLPKFKVEFDISLKPALQKLGMSNMFTGLADFSSLVESKAPLSISEVKHKAFIEVNELGTEAAAATYAKAYLQSLVLNEVIYDFVADHPFVFAIKDNEHVYFAGHINSP